MFSHKLVAGVLLAVTAVACSQAEPNEKPASSESAVIGDILTMTQRADGKFDVLCRDQSRVVVSVEDIQQNKVCGAPAMPAGQLGIIYGRSDSCDTDNVVMNVRENTDCFALSNTDIAWSVKVNGQCKNIPDTTVRGACLGLMPKATLIYGRTDSCETDKAVMRVTDATDCFALSNTDIAWSVSVDGQCKNISDTNVRAACLALQPKGIVLYGRSDSCDGETAFARITAETDCLKFNTTDIVWSVSTDGHCDNVSDTNARAACIEAQSKL